MRWYSQHTQQHTRLFLEAKTSLAQNIADEVTTWSWSVSNKFQQNPKKCKEMSIIKLQAVATTRLPLYILY